MRPHRSRIGIALAAVLVLTISACGSRTIAGESTPTSVASSSDSDAAAPTASESGSTDSSETSTESGDATSPDGVDLVDVLPAGTGAVDEVTWAVVEGEPQTLDPVSSASVITPNLCDNLLRLEPDFSIAPGVATSAEWVNPVTFVIELRDDVTFWDGTPVTADDVVYSLERNRNPESQWYAAFVLIDTIKATGDHEVTVTFQAPDTTFRDALSGGGGVVMSRAFGEKAGKNLGTADGGLMCSGPYQLTDWKPGAEIDTTANENYWDGAPLVKSIRYVFVTDGSTLTTALVSGEIDGAYNVAPGSRAALQGDGAGTLYLGHSTTSYSFGPTTNTGAAANPDIRRALSMAIDRQQYISAVLSGLGEVQKTFVPPFVWNNMEARDIYQAAYDALPDPVYDIDAAKELVANSGEDTSIPLVVAVPAGSKEFSQTAAIMQAAGQQIGLTIQINEMQPADFGALFYVPELRSSVDFVATTGYLDTPGVLGYPQLFLLPADRGGVFNWSDYANPDVTAKIEAARTATDPVAAANAFVDAQKIYAPDQLQVTLASAYQLTYLSKKLTGVVTSVAMYSSPWALHLGAQA